MRTSFAATTITSLTTNFTAIGADTALTQNNGGVTYSNPDNQGSGVRLDGSAAFSTTAPTYINFTARVGVTPQEIFYGFAGDLPNSADGTNPNSTAFAVGISTNGVSYFSQGTGTNLAGLDTPIPVSTNINFQVVITPTGGSNVTFFYDLSATRADNGLTQSVSNVQANQNPQSATNTASYTFNGIGTRNGAGNATDNILSNVVISDMPIPVPEPSSILLMAAGGLTCGLRRRRA